MDKSISTLAVCRATNPVLVREATEDERNRWDDLVVRFTNSRLFHKISWLRSIESFSGARPLFLVFSRGGQIVACMPGFIVRKAFLKIFGSPLIGWQTESMGPVFDPALITTRELFCELVHFLTLRHGVHHIELICTGLDRTAMSDLGFQETHIFTQRVPLFPGNPSRVLKSIHSKTRNQLRKAIKLGLRTRVENNDTFVDEFYAQTKEVFTRRNSAVSFSKYRALALFRHMRQSSNLLALSVLLPDSDTSIATGIFLIDGTESHLWMWTHGTQYGWYCPTELLMWTAMEISMQAGCVTMDMAGGGTAKQKYGAIPDLSVSRWTWSRYQWLRFAREKAERVYRWQQKLRGRISKCFASCRATRQSSRELSAPGREEV